MSIHGHPGGLFLPLHARRLLLLHGMDHFGAFGCVGSRGGLVDVADGLVHCILRHLADPVQHGDGGLSDFALVCVVFGVELSELEKRLHGFPEVHDGEIAVVRDGGNGDGGVPEVEQFPCAVFALLQNVGAGAHVVLDILEVPFLGFCRFDHLGVLAGGEADNGIEFLAHGVYLGADDGGLGAGGGDVTADAFAGLGLEEGGGPGQDMGERFLAGRFP